MSCYHPLKAFEIYYDKKNKKPKYKITSYAVKYLEITKNGTVIKRYDRCNSSNNHNTDSIIREVTNFIEIPCGKCVGCRLDYSKHWADRCMLELQDHKSSYFVTLTYDDFHLPMTKYVDKQTGEICNINTLVKDDFRTFIRHLRQQTGQKIRYFMAGEYGSHTLRPHYHAILFGLELNDLQVVGKNKLGQNYFSSPTILRAWNDGDGIPKGFVTLGEVTWETCAYTARYVMKKVGSDPEAFTSRNMCPEFTLMSRMPGIGSNYFYKNPDMFEYEHINYSTPQGGKSCSIPRYFRKLYEKELPEEAKKLRQKRRYISVNRRLKEAQTSKSYEDMLLTEEAVKVNSIKSLERSKL